MEMREVKEPAGIELTISDSGIGMSTQQLAAAFQPFHTTKAHGLGVGLPMVRRAMERFGGSVTLTSAEKAGTQVRLRFRT
jgi:signal transduction histidine kinase